jgi:hypothetical protein
MSDAPARPRARRREPLVLIVAWLLLAWGCAEVAASTQGSYDTYRDLWFATAIAQAIEFPHTGPVINQTFHLGPLWFYLLAAFATVLPGAKAAYWLTGLVVAARFPLAWIAGRMLDSPRLALWFVAIMAIPGWWTWQLVAVTHTAATECAILLLLVAALAAWRAPSPWRAVGVAAAATFALHAHPTTLPFAALALGATAWRAIAARRLVALPPLVAVPLLAFAPYLASDDFTRDLGAIAGYTQSLLAPQAPLSRFASLVASVLFGAGLFAAHAWLALDLAEAWMVAALPWALAALAVSASLRAGLAPRLGRIAGAALALFLAQCVFLLLARPISPYWMTFALYPPLALGIAALAASHRRSARASLGAALGIGAIALATTTLGLALLARFEDELWWPTYPPGSGGAMTVTSWPDGRVRALVPAYGLRDVDALVAPVCTPTALHGPLAVVGDRTLGYPWLARCGRHDHVVLGGPASDGDRFGIWGPKLARACGMGSRALLDAQPRIPFRVLGTAAAVPLGDPHRYPPRHVAPAIAQQVLTFVDVPHRFIVVTNVLPDYAPMTVASAAVPGRHVERLATPGAWALFDCTDCAPGTVADWQVAVEADPRALDIVAFDCPVGR